MGYVCVHGHFYQPPRENPWLEEVEVQDSAEPYHDWNERITAECYRPNGRARVLDREGLITEIRNNYSRISFDFGPTLLTWLERHAPEEYATVLDSDRESQRRFSGHGSALAQGYNHAILPLADRRDKTTQVVWGIRDFERRFGRRPEGMWLPETAVDLPTLEVLADQGIGFTILAPRQARRVRPVGGSEWTEVGPDGPDTTRAYTVPLPSGRSVTVFFYDGAASHDIAFGGLLHNGPALADRLLAPLRDGPADSPKLSHVATDGETFGHHHRHGEMALAVALKTIESGGTASLTNYGEFLGRHPPTAEAEIHEMSSWSCAHGVERWRSDCGCNSGLVPGANQRWRAPLRTAFDHLRDRLAPKFEALGGQFFADPWAARDRYLDLVVDRSDEAVAAFFRNQARRTLGPEEIVTALLLLELGRQLQLMYTSCGWFFDDLAGIETVQILQYAARAVQLGERLFGEPFEEALLTDLEGAVANGPEHLNGRALYERWIRPVRIDLRNVCAHYALSSLFEHYPDAARIYCFRVERREQQARIAGAARLLVGQVEVSSEITRERERFTYGALTVGGPSLFGGVRPFQGDSEYRATSEALIDAFERGDLPESVRRVDQNFGEGTYTARLLFRDEQRKIIGMMLEETRASVEAEYRAIYETTAPILRFLAEVGSPAPRPLRAAAEFYLNQQIVHALQRDSPDLGEIAPRRRELARLNLVFDAEPIAFAWSRGAERLLDQFAARPDDPGPLRAITSGSELLFPGRAGIDLSRLQDRFYDLLRTEYLPRRARSAGPGEPNPEWSTAFAELGRWLGVRVP